MKAIKQIDLQKEYSTIQKIIEKKVLEVIKNQNFILGKETKQLEKNFANYCGKKYCLGVGSGTDALYVALSCLGFQPGDEVLVPVFTFIATAEVVTLLGGKVVFCDIDPQTGLIDPLDVAKRISSKTRFIIPVHLYGQLADIPKLKKIIGNKNIQIIEDAAQAHGASKKGKKSPLADIATYSFYPAKNLGAYGDAGAIVTNSIKLLKKASLLRNHGQKIGKKYFHTSIGFNFRMDEIQAAVLNVKLKYLNSWNKKRQEIAQIYNRELHQIFEIKILNILPGNIHVYHQFAIRAEKRNELQIYLKNNGVDTRIHYPLPLHLQKAYKHLGYRRGDFPNAEKLSREILCLPIYPNLPKKEALFIARLIKKFYL